VKGHGERKPKLPKIRRGHCRYCGCTDERACVLPKRKFPDGVTRGRTCWWIDAEHTVCSASGCFKKYELEAA